MAGATRWFIGAATTQYSAASGLGDRLGLSDGLDRLRGLFTRLGYSVVPGFGTGLTVREFQRRLRAFMTAPVRTADDVVVVYYTGHAFVHHGHLMLPMADTDDDRVFTSLRAGDLTTRVLDDRVLVRRILFILDTCHAAVGGATAAHGAIEFINRINGLTDNPAVGVLVATRPDEEAVTALFSKAFVAAVETPARDGQEPDHLPLDQLVDTINALTPPWQNARFFYAADSVTPFLPNPRLDRWLLGLDERTAAQNKLQADRNAEQVDHVLPHARGLASSDAQESWLFTGRHNALRELCEWLRTHSPATMIVTGDPGSGKSALLARLFVLADRRLRGQIPNVHTLPAETVPDDGTIRRFVHARGKTARDLLDAIAEACGLDAAPSPGHLLQALRGQPPFTVIVDAIDEAIGNSRDQPGGWFAPVDEVLVPLVRGAVRAPLRLLIGTRRHLVDRFTAGRVVDLDSPAYADPDSVRGYVTSCLAGLGTHSPYRAADPRRVARIADAIAEAAGGSFLVALITARSHAMRPAIADPGDRAWRAALPRFADESMHMDLVERLRDQTGQARDLLLPLAYAFGTGLPREDIWPKLASALSGRSYTSAHLDWLLGVAGFYVVELSGSGRQSVYRLYHQSLAEHLRSDRDEKADQTTIVDVLAAHTGSLAGGGGSWDNVHPYVAAHLASHAATTDRLDGLVTDPRFLLTAHPAPLLNALPATRSRPGRLAADAYRRAQSHLRSGPLGERAAYLQLAARCGRAPQLAEAIIETGIPVSWLTRWASWRLQPPHQTIPSHSGGVWSVAIRDVGGRTVIVSGGLGHAVRMYDAATGTAVGEALTGHVDGVWSVVTGEIDGRDVIVSGGADGAVRIWDALDGIPSGGPLVGHVGGVWSVSIGEAGGRTVIASGGADGTVRVWDASTGTPLGDPIRGQTDGVNSVAVGRIDGHSVIVSGGANGLVRVWSTARGVPLREPLAGHLGAIWSVAIGDLDGRTVIVSGGVDGQVRVWDAATGAVTGAFIGHNGGVNAVAIGQVDGRGVIVSGGDDGTVRVWDAVGAPMTVPFAGHTDGVWSVALDRVDGRDVIVSGGADGTVRVWDAVAGALIADPFSGHDKEIRAVAVGELDGRPVIVSTGDDRTIRVWDAATGDAVREPMTGHAAPVNALAVRQAGDHLRIVTGDADGALRLWDTVNWPPAVVAAAGHPGGVWSVATGQIDGRMIVASGGADGVVRLWEFDTGAPLGAPFVGHAGGVNAVAVARIGERTLVVSGGADRTVRLWDPTTGAADGPALTGHTGGVWAVTVGEVDGRVIVVSGSDDRTVRVWDATTREPVGPPYAGHSGRIWSVAVGKVAGTDVVVSGSADRTVRIWDLNGVRAGATLTGHTAEVGSVAIGELKGRTVIVSGGADRTVRIWDAATGTSGDSFTGHTGGVSAVATGELDGCGVVVSGGDDRTVRIWDRGTGAAVGNPLAGHGDRVRTLSVGELDGRVVIVSGSDDRTVRVWDASDGVPVGDPLVGHSTGVHAVAIGRVDGRSVIVSGGADGTVRVWDPGSGAQTGAPLAGHAGRVWTVAFGRRHGRTMIVSGSDDRTLRIWDPTTGEPVGSPLTGHTGRVSTVTTGRIGDRDVIVSGGDDRTVRMWDASTGEPVGPPLAGHAGRVRAVAIHHDAGRVVIISGGDDGTVRVWSPSAAVEILVIDLSVPVSGLSVRGTAIAVVTELGVAVLALPASTFTLFGPGPHPHSLR